MSDSSRPAQDFTNHVVRPNVFGAAALVLAIDVVVRIVQLVRTPGAAAAWAVIVGGALFTLAALLRRNSLLLQDRIIRLESRLRLERVLPADRHADIARLGLGQLISLRFASDAELPALVEEVLAKEIRDRSEIKRKIKDWQADWHRV